MPPSGSLGRTPSTSSRGAGDPVSWPLGETARLVGLTWRAPACLHKKRHATWEAAEAHRLDVLYNHGSDGEPLEVYWCASCPAWHVGRSRLG